MSNTLWSKLQRQDPSLVELFLNDDIHTLCARPRWNCERYYILDFIESLLQNVVIEKLVLGPVFMHSIQDQEIDEFLSAVGRLQNLRIIEMRNFEICLDLHLIEIVLGLGVKIKDLKLEKIRLVGSGCEFGHRTSYFNAKLATFTMIDCFITMGAPYPPREFPFDPLFQYLSRCKALEKISIQQCDCAFWTPDFFAKLAVPAGLRKLLLVKLKLTVPHLQALADRADCRKLMLIRELDLSENPTLGNGACSALVNSRKMLSCLVELNLNNCGITDDGVQLLVEGILAFQPPPSLSESIVYNNSFESPVSYQTTLQALTLSKNNIGKAGVNYIVKLLEDTGVHINLEKLYLVDCGIQHGGAVAIANALRTNQTLVELDLRSNGFLENAIPEFATVLEANNMTLCNLRFGATIGDEVQPALSKIILYLELNKTGRKQLVQDTDNVAAWNNALYLVKDDVSCLYWLIRTLPTIVTSFSMQRHLFDN